MSSFLQLMLAEIWQHLDNAAIPAPSHRNRTMTDWSARMERAKVMLSDARNAAMEADIQLRELATVRKLNETAAGRHQALANEIERLRGENRLILDALGMEKYRVRWRPVSDGFFKTTGDELLIVHDDPAWIAPVIMIARWDRVSGWTLRNGNPVEERTVKFWSPLPELPEEVAP